AQDFADGDYGITAEADRGNRSEAKRVFDGMQESGIGAGEKSAYGASGYARKAARSRAVAWDSHLAERQYFDGGDSNEGRIAGVTGLCTDARCRGLHAPARGGRGAVG